MKNISKTIAIFVAVMSLHISYSCSDGIHTEEIEKATNVVDSFVGHYFNLDLKASLSYCTPESNLWLSFLASNINQEDIDVINEQEEPAKTEIENVELISDTSATATCIVKNFLKLDTLGKPGRIVDEEKYMINLVKRNGKWLVKMEGLPQNEKQSHGLNQDEI